MINDNQKLIVDDIQDIKNYIHDKLQNFQEAHPAFIKILDAIELAFDLLKTI